MRDLNKLQKQTNPYKIGYKISKKKNNTNYKDGPRLGLGYHLHAETERGPELTAERRLASHIWKDNLETNRLASLMQIPMSWQWHAVKGIVIRWATTEHMLRFCHNWWTNLKLYILMIQWDLSTVYSLNYYYFYGIVIRVNSTLIKSL